MDNFKNLYELRKTVRFELKPVGKTLENIKKYHPQNRTENNINVQINKFTEKYQLIIGKFEKLIFFVHNENNGRKLDKNITIKHSWLRNYTKTEFYDAKDRLIQLDREGRKRSNKSSISDQNLKFLQEYFENWFKENKECIENINLYSNQPEEAKKRISEYAYWVQKILKRSNFEFISELFNGNISHKNDNSHIDAIKIKIYECRNMLLSLEKDLLPSQSFGLEIDRASLNYYTVNKKPKDYPVEIQKKQKELQQCYSFTEQDIDLFNKIGFAESLVGLDKVKNAMKLFRAKQKSMFYEFASQNRKYSDLKKDQNLKLLNDINENNFNKFCASTDKQEKGKHFQYNFPKYKCFNKTYGKVAVAFGKINAEIKALEKEKNDAERIKCWGLILEKDNQKYALTIPRDANNNLGNAKRYIDTLKGGLNGEWKLYAFESLTLRALNKLCFGLDKNTFLPNIKNELKQKERSFFDGDNLKRKDQFSKYGTELLKFYQIVLGLNSTKLMLAVDNFINFSNLCTKKYDTIVDFEKELKQICYYKKAITISEDRKNKIVDNFHGNFYKITSYDLEKNDKEEITKLTRKGQFDRKNPEAHTKMWLDFWTNKNAENNHEVRLNPEFKISFIEKQPEKIVGRSLGELKKNRKLEDRYLLSTTIALQAHDKNVDLSFKKTEEIVDFINNYNTEFNKHVSTFDVYYYGLDRGQKELLTLGIFKFSNNEKVTFAKEDGTQGEYCKPEFIDLDIYQIKSTQLLTKNTVGRISYKSPDLFIDDTSVVEKVSIKSCLDLSCAKLIKNTILLNGDIATYLELKRISALRKIHEGETRGKFRSEKICFNAEKDCLFLNIENKGKIENESLYFYDERFASILPLYVIQNELQKYFEDIKTKKDGFELISIDKINNLRDALSANAVGILNYLQKTYSGIMVFEDLDINNKIQRITEFSGNLASRIELKLLQKFQILGLVPPSYKQAMTLQSTKKIDQLGIVVYVKTSGTSNQCPHCEVQNTDKSEKWNAHAYKCKNCNFDTTTESKRRGLVALDNSDSVASYNIAKGGLKCLKTNKI